MLRNSWRWCCGLALLLLAGGASAQVGPGDAAERERIVRDRAAAQALFQAARSDCEARFATTACLDAARAERRGTLERLKREEVLLDTALRRQRAADRMRRIQDKAREADARPSAAALPATPGHGPMEKKVRKPVRTPRAAVAPPEPPAVMDPAQPAAAAASAPMPASAPAKRSAPSARRSDDAASREARRAAYERRQAELQAHRDAVLRRNAERAARAKPAAPLPPRPGVPAE